MYDIAFDPYRFHTSFGLEEAIKHQESKEEVPRWQDRRAAQPKMSNSLPTKIKTVAKKNPDPRNRGKGKLRGPGLRAVHLFTEQALSGVYKPVEDTLLEAGYAPQSARQITNVMIGIRAHVEPIVQEMEEHRQAVMANMTDKVGRASYGELVRSLDVTTRNIRLLIGKSTHNFALQAEHRHKLDALIEDNT